MTFLKQQLSLRFRRGTLVLAGLWSLTLASSCIVVASDDEPERSAPFVGERRAQLPETVGQGPAGVAYLQWAIAGDADPVKCALIGAENLNLRVFDSTDEEVLQIDTPCAEFGVIVELDSGRYDFEATLQDGQGDSVSLSLVNSARIAEEQDAIVDLNFALEDLF